MRFYTLVGVVSVITWAKRAKAIGGGRPVRYRRLVHGFDEPRPSTAAEVGFLPVYVGEEKRRFVIPTGFLSHPLFRMLLERASREYGFEQRGGLIFPCDVSMFQEVMSAVECSHGQFSIEGLVEGLM